MKINSLKKNISKIVAIVTLILIFFSTFGFNLILAKEEISKKENLEKVKNAIEIKSKNETNNQEIDIIKASPKEDEVVSQTNIPQSYEYGKQDSTVVHKYYQEHLGLCWAFTGINLAETSAQKLLKKRNEPKISRRHIDYISSNRNLNNPYITGRDLTDGSTLDFAQAYGINGAGFVYEKDFNFHYENKNLTNSDLDKKRADYSIIGTENFPRIIKKYEGSRIRYYSDGSTSELSKTEINNIRNKVKSHIINKGAVGTKIYVSDGKSFYSGTGNHLFIHPSNPIKVNHAVTIVGWDDNISKDKFVDQSTGLKPEINGAWLIEDTRGGEPRGLTKSETRYFVSYDSVNVEASHWTGVTDMKNIDSNTEGSYKTKSWGTNTQLSIGNDGKTTRSSISIYKVFTKNTDTEENIKGLGIYIENPITVEATLIPKLEIKNTVIDAINDLSPVPVTKTFNLTRSGYNYLDLAQSYAKIVAKKGEKFAVKLTFKSPDRDITVPIEAKSSNGMSSEISKIMSQVKFPKNETFLSVQSENLTGENAKSFITPYECFYGDEKGSTQFIAGISEEKRFVLDLYTNFENYVRVNFDLDGGQGDISFQSVPIGSYVKVPTNPYKQGHIFKGWSPDITKPITKATTFKAIWEKVEEDIEYNVSYDLNGGEVSGLKEIPTVKVKQGQKAPFQIPPTKDGYIFAGWTPNINEPIYKDTTFIANWRLNLGDKILVRFYLSGGNIDGQIMVPAQYLEKGKVHVLNIKDPTREGYIFTGWKPDINIPITEDTDYIAQWKSIEDLPQKYIVTFDTNGGIGAYKDLEVEEGTVLDNIPNPAKEKYKFMGWEPDIKTPIHQNTVFKAKWQLNEVGFTLKFNTPGKSDIIKQIPYGGKPIDYLKEEEINPIRDGYNFEGWSVDLNKPLTNEFNNISAQWSKKPIEEHTLSFYYMTGKIYKRVNVPAGEIVDKDKLKEVAAPRRDDHIFDGWDFDFSNPITKNENIFAKWRIELKPQIQMKFNLNGGKFFLSSNQTYTKKRNESFNKWLENIIKSLGINKEEKIPKRDGYTFVCWVDEENNVKFPHTSELKNKYQLKAVWADGETGKITDEILDNIYNPVDPNDEENIIDNEKEPEKPSDPNKPNNPEEDKDKDKDKENNPNENKNDNDKDKEEKDNNIGKDNNNNNNQNNNTNNNTHNNSSNTNNSNNQNQNNTNNNSSSNNSGRYNENNYNNGNSSNIYDREKSDSRRMNFYDPNSFSSSRTNDNPKNNTNKSNNLSILDNKKENKKTDKVEKDNPYTGLEKNTVIIASIVILMVVSTILFIKIKLIDKKRKINIY